MDAISKLGKDESALHSRDHSRGQASKVYTLFLTAVGLLVAGLVLGVVATIVIRGLPMMSWEFLTAQPRDNMSKGGIAPMILGSLYLLIGTLVVTLPVGLFGGIFLAEYAGTKSWVGLARALITSLAGTPSIIYGLFGFAVFVILLGRLGELPQFQWLGLTVTQSLYAGILTLSLMALPIVVLSTETAIRAVPQSQFDGSYALGLTRWQTIWRVVLPQAVPGILTGLMLATGRAMGEAPPILLTAGIFFTTIQAKFQDTLREPVMNLPYHITETMRQSTAFREEQVWGTCLVLLLFMFVMNLFAIVLRSRHRKKRLG